MLRRVGAVLVSVAFVVLGLAAPSASAGAKCLEYGEEINPITNRVEIVCVQYASDAGTPPTDDDKNEGSSGKGGGKTECKYDGRTIPCSSNAGTWNAAQGCYAHEMKPQPPKDAVWWEGNDDGVIVECTPPNCTGAGGGGDLGGIGNCVPRVYWAPGPPEATAGPSPRELADRAVASMRLSMGEIGSTPPSTEVRADSMGLVGVPMWLWVANPAENTTGPISRSSSGGGLTVTARATLDRIDWSLTDRDSGAARHSMSCAGENAAGTPWSDERDGDGSVPSPTCGFPAALNDRAGHYTLTGTAHWVVEWRGGGQTGTIEVPPQERSVPIDIGESQVIITQ